MTPELKDRILDIADEVCKKNGSPVRARQGSDYLNHPQCNFHAMGSKPQQGFIASVKAEIQPKVYYPVSSLSDLDCLPEGWAEYPAHEQLVVDVVAGFIGYIFDHGWNLWETFNVPAEFGFCAMSESSTVSSSTSGSTLHDTVGNPPVKSTSTSSSSSNTRRPGPGPKQSITKTTSSTSSADAFPTDITIDPTRIRGMFDGPTPTGQIPLVPIVTVTGKMDLPCQAYLDPHNKNCNVCTCSSKKATITVPMSHKTYVTPVKVSLVTTSDACWYTSWPNTKSVSTTTCLDGNQIAQSKSIASVMSSIRNHLTDLSDYTPGAPARTCSPDPHHKLPICALKTGGHDDLPARYCDCPGPTPSVSTPYSTTSTSLVSCDPKLGTVTHLDVCPWTTTPPDSMKINTVPQGTAYPGGTLPPVQTATPSCVPNDPKSPDFVKIPAFLGSYLQSRVNLFCTSAVDGRWKLGPGAKDSNRMMGWADADKQRNSIGDPRPKDVVLFVQWDERACPAHFDDEYYVFSDMDSCIKMFSNPYQMCGKRQWAVRGQLNTINYYFFGGGMYQDCMWWEISTGDKFNKQSGKHRRFMGLNETIVEG